MGKQRLNLRESRAILRRRWIAIASLAGLGLCVGAGYALVQVPEPAATVGVTLPSQTAPDADLTGTDIKMLETAVNNSQLLTAVATSVSPPIQVAQLQDLVSAATGSDNTLQIEVRAQSSERALQLANAVASQYAEYVANHHLVDGRLQLTSTASLITPPSKVSRIATDALLGLVAGLIAGTVAVLIQVRRDNRLRRRDQIADAIGVPVLASMNAEQYKGVDDWIRLLQRFEPSAMNALILRRVLRHLIPADFDNPFTIQVISFVGDKAALATGPELALFAAGSGIRTRLAPDENIALEPLIAACAALRTSNHADQLLTFGTEPEQWTGPMGRPTRWYDDPVLTEPHVVVSVVAVEPSRPELASITGPAILALSSGFAHIDDLARVALASTRAGAQFEGIVVVNPDPADTTTGLLPGRLISGSKTQNGRRRDVADHWPTSRAERHGRHSPAARQRRFQ